MTSRQALYGAGLAGIMAAATLLAAPYRPNLVALPAEWPDPSDGQLRLAIFPSGAAYAGDRVGLDASSDSDPGGHPLEVRLDRPGNPPIAETNFYFREKSGEWGIQLPWMWDSSGAAGWRTLLVNLAGPTGAWPETILRQYPIRILPAALRPLLRRNAAWQEASSACCTYSYLSGTESERDIAGLIAKTEEIYKKLTEKMDLEAPTRGASTRGAPANNAPSMTLVFLPRLYGQGGLVINEAVLSYMDRNYTGTEFAVLLEHEMAHLYAVTFFPTGLRPPMILQEGWTVYLTGGHYRSDEPLQERAAVLVQTGRYIPLSNLANSFFSVQHETAYIEAGAFVEFLAVRFGPERVLDMFRDPAAGSPAAALDSMLGTHFQTALAECEAAWLDGLRRITPDPDQVRDVEFTLEMFDALRRYQRLYDPGGSMADLWLPDFARARSERITADYLPPPGTDNSITLETMFLAGRTAAEAREWDRARETMQAIERVLDATQRRAPDPISVSSLAVTYRLLVAAVGAEGDEPLSIDLSENQAVVEIRKNASLEKEVQRWDLIPGNWVRAK